MELEPTCLIMKVVLSKNKGSSKNYLKFLIVYCIIIIEIKKKIKNELIGLSERRKFMDKYCLTNEKITINGRTLYRIKALKDFAFVEAGDLGGFIEKEENLSQEGSAWVYDNACVYENARVYGNAKIYGDTRVYDNAKVYDDAIIKEDSIIYGNAKIFNQAVISGHSFIYSNVQIGQKIAIKGADCYSLTLEESVRCQTGLIPLNGKVIAYKQVRKDLTSFYDNDFQYKIGEWAEAKNFEISDKSCAAGLHFSNANYWNQAENLEESSFLIAEIRLEDIITVQEGKIRCKKAFILGKYDVPEEDFNEEN